MLLVHEHEKDDLETFMSEVFSYIQEDSFKSYRRPKLPNSCIFRHYTHTVCNIQRHERRKSKFPRQTYCIYDETVSIRRRTSKFTPKVIQTRFQYWVHCPILAKPSDLIMITAQSWFNRLVIARPATATALLMAVRSKREDWYLSSNNVIWIAFGEMAHESPSTLISFEHFLAL